MKTAWGMLVCCALAACAPAGSAWADPADVSGATQNPVQNQPAPNVLPPASVAGNPVADACTRFGAALNLAASNYEEFAYATAGQGNLVNYQDPNVVRTNVVGRTALREAAGVALDASRAPGLPPAVADPMRNWSLRATKLLVLMGLHGGGESLNSTATQLNTDAHDAQLACAVNGGHA